MLVCDLMRAGEDRGSGYVSGQMNGFPGDVSQRFWNGNHFSRKFAERGRLDDDDEGEGDVELSLGLSLNGRFGVDPKRAKTLIRSSSISNLMMSAGGTADDNNRAYLAPVAAACAYKPLTRTCSLPAETEEEWRKRKELQSLRRMEAKRKRLGKLKNVRVTTRDMVDMDENYEENSVFGSGNRVSDRGQQPKQSPSSQASQGSGSCTTNIPDFETQPIKANTSPDVKSPGSVQSMAEQIVTDKFAGVSMENSKPPFKVSTAAQEVVRNVMLEMPRVSTRGDGPHGRRIEGFLYRYRNGEEVRIVCVCHGSSLSPAEFVKHAGGGDVTHPLKHIVVNPAAPFL